MKKNQNIQGSKLKGKRKVVCVGIVRGQEEPKAGGCWNTVGEAGGFPQLARADSETHLLQNSYHVDDFCMSGSNAGFVFTRLFSPQNNALVRCYYLCFTDEDTGT